MVFQNKNGETYHTYAYADTGWSDLLTAFDGGAITYDNIGNPLTYHDGKTFTWTAGRRLASATDGETVITYAYDGDGNRIRKTVNGETTEYEYIDGKLLSLKKGADVLRFLYDETDTVYGFLYNGDVCYYVFNLQGDITGIRKADGWDAASYSYDAWGNPTGIYDDYTTLATLNPFRYRGYFYDDETGFYYLQSRYYDPEVGRFINSDGYISTGTGMLGYNMFAYCGNNPVNRVDPTGMFWKEIGNFFSKVWEGIKSWAKNTFGAGDSTTTTIAKVETPVIPDPSPVTVKTGTKTTKTISKKGDSSKPISVYTKRNAQHPVKSSSAGIKINIADFTLDMSLGLDNIGISGSLSKGSATDSFGVKLNLSEFKVGFEGSTAIQWDNTIDTSYTNVSVSGWAIVAAYILVTTGQYSQSPSYAHLH